MRGICLKTDRNVDGKKPACREARWWTKTFGMKAPLGVPLLYPRAGSEPLCEDCTMFQKESDELPTGRGRDT